MEQKLSLKVKLSKAINSIVFLLSIIFLLIAIISRANQIMFTICISVGTSLLATFIVTYLNRIYLDEKEQLSVLLNKWGIKGIYKQRSEINIETNAILDKTKHLDICAMGLKNFRSAQGNKIQKYVKRGLCIRILTIDPNSDILNLIDDSESQLNGYTKNTIESLINWVDEIKSTSTLRKNAKVQIRVYDHYPSYFYFAMDGTVWTGPYQAKDSQQTITFKFEKNSMGAEYYTEYFEDLWKNAKEV